MNAWETEFLASMESKNESRAIEILRSGFPLNYQLRLRDTNGNILPGYTYPLLYAIDLDLYELVHFILVSGGNINAFDCLGQTGLLIASQVGNLNMVQLLISNKGNIASRDFSGNTMLHLATLNSHLHVIKFCIETLKFPIIVQNNKSQVPLDVARTNQETCKSLQESEKVQQVIEYLWRTQEEFKRVRGKRFAEGSYLARKPRFTLNGLAKIPILPNEGEVFSPHVKRGLENYLNSKHTMIFKSFTAKEKNVTRLSRMAVLSRDKNPNAN